MNLKSSLSPDELIILARRFSINEPQPVGAGTEAEAYALDSERVLKVYRRVEALAGLETLRDFYHRTDTSRIDFAIPKIFECGHHGDVVYSVEQRLGGVPMSDIPGAIADPRMAELYIDTALSVAKITVNPPYGRRRPLGADNPPGDWYQFIREQIAAKRQALASSLPPAVVESLGPVEKLAAYFDRPYMDTDLLVHGDYHPGNVLMKDGRISALIDFGFYTLFGDPLYDAATACGYFSMYEPDQASTRKFMLARLLDKIGRASEATVYAYLLFAALTTCDHFPDESMPIQETGHFQWAQSVLSDKYAWDVITS